MSLLQGNFKKQLRRAMNPETWDSPSCPRPQVEPEFTDKMYTEETFEPGPEFCEKLSEDERLEFLLRMKGNMNEYFENTAYANPHGMSSYDYKSIGMSRRDALESHKMKLRRENYKYMKDHPEIDAMIEVLIRKLLIARPHDPIKYTAEYFCIKQSSYEDHRREIEEEREKIKIHRKIKSKEFYNPKINPAPTTTMRKLNLGPLAGLLDFSKMKVSEAEPEPEVKVKPPQPYCGCKDWKKNRPKGEKLPANGSKAAEVKARGGGFATEVFTEEPYEQSEWAHGLKAQFAGGAASGFETFGEALAGLTSTGSIASGNLKPAESQKQSQETLRSSGTRMSRVKLSNQSINNTNN